jgi:protein-L-isoaspartate(D-aspartate) O-methyltransferase
MISAYLGDAASAPHDRIIVTCGITGISPHWPAQLTRCGLMLAPVAHGGLHPILAITTGGGTLCGHALFSCDFMTAAGPLYQWPAGRTQVPAQPVPANALTVAPAIGPELSPDQYQDLWFYLGARDLRITRAASVGINPALGLCALHDPDAGTAWIQRDGTAYATGDRSVMQSLARYVTDWDRCARPALSRWACTFQAIGPANALVHAPARWQLDSQQ